MRLKIPIILLLSYAFLWYATGCVKPYEPPEIAEATSLLVVDGMLQAGANATTVIRLSRTRKLSDTTTTLPEEDARVTIEGAAGARYQLPEGPAGTYSATGLPLQASGKYRLFIETTGGTQAASDYVSFKPTPAIDSLSWEEQNGIITVFLDTHDPQNDTRYYRWAYEETWEYRVPYDAIVAYKNGTLFFRDTNDQRYRCWSTSNSNNILLGTSAALSNDVVSKKQILKLKAASSKMGERYSVRVKQYALDKEAFEYWQILQKNTEQRGSLFDAQPSQLTGNIHNLNNASEPVIGYLSASSVTEKRLFIKRSEILDKYTPPATCTVTIVPTDSAVFYIRSLNKMPAYFISPGSAIALSTAECVDCTLQGGTNVKPIFW